MFPHLEQNKILIPELSGFQKQRGTIDHLVCLEAYIYDLFAHKQHVVAVFFDLEKAYDMTWKYGIYEILKIVELKDTYQYLFKIILVIVNLKYYFLTPYLNNLNKKLESLKESITLFILNINDITNCLAHDIDNFL